MSTDTYRLAVMMSAEDRGWSMATAGLVAMALHPFDDRPVPGRSFEKVVRKQSRKAARHFRGASDEAAAELARSLVSSYRSVAIDEGEAHYSTRYDKVLGLEV